MTKKPKQEAIRQDKQELFQEFLKSADHTLTSVERWFNGDGVRSRFFGLEGADDCSYFEDIQVNESQTNTVRSSLAWQTLSALYDYAVEGVAEEENMFGLLMDCDDLLELIGARTSQGQTERQSGWRRIAARCVGRLDLDAGNDIFFEELAVLADVDVRTVRNAISAGELVAYKSTDGINKGLFVENASSRSWLQNRRGFKPTVFRTPTANSLDGITTPAEFGAFLVARRESLGLDTGGGKLLPMAPGSSTKNLAAVEAGVFEMSLNAVNPLADFYQLERKAFLGCVMRVFFSDYYATILESQNA